MPIHLFDHLFNVFFSLSFQRLNTEKRQMILDSSISYYLQSILSPRFSYDLLWDWLKLPSIPQSVRSRADVIDRGVAVADDAVYSTSYERHFLHQRSSTKQQIIIQRIHFRKPKTTGGENLGVVTHEEMVPHARSYAGFVRPLSRQSGHFLIRHRLDMQIGRNMYFYVLKPKPKLLPASSCPGQRKTRNRHTRWGFDLTGDLLLKQSSYKLVNKVISSSRRKWRRQVL